MSSPLPSAGPEPQSNSVLADQIARLQQEVRELSRRNNRTIRRNDGSIAFDVGELDTGESFAYFTDASGNVILSEDAVSGLGLARPWIPITFVPVRAEVMPMMTGATFVATAASTDVFQIQQAKLRVQSVVLTSGGAAGEIRYTINGVPTGAVEVIGVNQYTYTTIQDLDLTGVFGQSIYVTVECRVTNGIGSCGAWPAASQRQS